MENKELEEKKEEVVEELEIEENKESNNEEQIEENIKSNNIGIIIISIIYSLAAVPEIYSCAIAVEEILSEGYSFLDIWVLLLIIFVFLIPYIMLIKYFSNKNKSLKTSIIYIEIILFLLATLIWLSFPSNKPSHINEQWENISVYTNK